MLTGIPVSQAIDADLYARPAHLVLQSVDPIPVDFGHPDAHISSVSYKLQVSSTFHTWIRKYA